MKKNYRFIPKGTSFEILGEIYKSWNDFQPEKSTIEDLRNDHEKYFPDFPLTRRTMYFKNDSYSFEFYIDVNANYIIRYSQSFPTFDSHDRFYDSGSFYCLIICKTEEEVLQKYKLIKENNESFNDITKHSSELAPLVYAKDRSDGYQVMWLTEE